MDLLSPTTGPLAALADGAPPEWAPGWLPDALPLMAVVSALYVAWQIDGFRQTLASIGSRIDLALAAFARLHHLP